MNHPRPIYHWRYAHEMRLVRHGLITQKPLPEMLEEGGLSLVKVAFTEVYIPGVPRNSNDTEQCLVIYDRDYVKFWLYKTLAVTLELSPALLSETLAMLDLQVIKDTASLLGLRLTKK